MTEIWRTMMTGRETNITHPIDKGSVDSLFISINHQSIHSESQSFSFSDISRIKLVRGMQEEEWD